MKNERNKERKLLLLEGIECSNDFPWKSFEPLPRESFLSTNCAIDGEKD